MLETSARLLELLSLLQVRREWSGRELSDRLDVTTRTLRRDVDRLRTLGYPVEATAGVGGGYRLGAGAEMPPLLLADAEVLAVALGLDAVTTGSVEGMAEASTGALVKLRQVMPSRLRHRLDALSLEALPHSGQARPAVSADDLTAVATACHRHERLRFAYRAGDGTESRRDVEPYRLVRNGRRWYLVAWDTQRDDWRSFRVDRMRPTTPTGPRFRARDLPDGGASAFLERSLGTVYRRAHARIRVQAPIDQLATMISDSWGTLESGDQTGCEVALHSTSLSSIARWLHAFDADFTVLEPDELRTECARLAAHHERVADRYRRAAEDTD
ncbi:MAG: YafY family protein [Gordonia sp. (in: high G+C Gram-positive bacteria)]